MLGEQHFHERQCSTLVHISRNEDDATEGFFKVFTNYCITLTFKLLLDLIDVEIHEDIIHTCHRLLSTSDGPQ
jgi:hypothetical protein